MGTTRRRTVRSRRPARRTAVPKPAPKDQNPNDPKSFSFRLKKNGGSPGLKGPEPLGCVNSGVAPVIVRDKLSGLFFVGDQGAYEDMSLRCRIRAAHLLGNGDKRRTYKIGTFALKVFRTKAPAVAEFEKRVKAITDRNAYERREVAAAREKLRSGSHEEQVQAALTLSDYGLLVG